MLALVTDLWMFQLAPKRLSSSSSLLLLPTGFHHKTAPTRWCLQDFWQRSSNNQKSDLIVHDHLPRALQRPAIRKYWTQLSWPLWMLFRTKWTRTIDPFSFVFSGLWNFTQRCVDTITRVYWILKLKFLGYFLHKKCTIRNADLSNGTFLYFWAQKKLHHLEAECKEHHAF